jgi:hypothetical protein
MLSIHYQLTNTQIELGQAFALLYRLRMLIGAMPLALDVVNANATHVIAGPISMQTQYLSNLRSLIDSFVNSTDHVPPGLVVEVVDLTV